MEGEVIMCTSICAPGCVMKVNPFLEQDYQAVCDFLLELNRQGVAHMNWNWARWEWMYQHPYCDRALLPHIGLWKDGNKVVGAAIFDLFRGEAFCAALPGYRHLLPEIYADAWENLRGENGLGIAAADGDTEARALLKGLGYEKAEQAEALYALELEDPLCYTLPEGFAIREIRFPEDNFAYQRVIWKGFGHEGDNAELEKMLRNEVLPPHRRTELCLAVTDGSEFAAHCTCWYDTSTDYAYIEPVCTIPQYRGRGLGRAVVSEALNRCARLGAKRALVLSDQMFYQKLGFRPLEHYQFYWKQGAK